MAKLELVKVFIASPGDLTSERKLFSSTLQKFNKLRARSAGHQLEPSGWEETLLGVGRPQELINEVLRQCDIFVMLLWHRWGTPTGKFSAGTEEEFSVAYELFQKDRSPHILLYFRSVPQAQRADPGGELIKINEFRTKIEVDKTLLYGGYDKPKQWEEQLMVHLSQWLDRKLHGPNYSVADNGAGIIEEVKKMKLELQKLQLEIKETNVALKTKESKLRAAAIALAVEATRMLNQGKLTMAEEKFAQSVELYEEPEVLINFGLFLFQIGALERAKAKFEQVQNLPSNAETDPQRAMAYKRLGNVNLMWGKLTEAEQMFEHAIEIARRLKRKDLIADFQGSLGNIYIERGEIHKAEKAYVGALKIAKAVGDQDGLRKAYGSLGNIYIERRKWAKAKTAVQKSHDFAEALRHKEGMENALLGLGLVSEGQKRFDDAEAIYKQALKLAKSQLHKAGMERAYGNLGNLYATRGDLHKAKRMYEEALELAKTLGRKEGMANTFNNLSIIHEQQGEPAQAREMLLRALELYQDIGNKAEVKRLGALLNRKTASQVRRSPLKSSASKAGKRLHVKASSRKMPGVRKGYRPSSGKK